MTALNWISQGSMIALTAGVVLVLLTHARAQSRYAVCWFALGAVFMLVLAALALFRPEALTAVLRGLSPSGAGPEAMHSAMGRLLPFYYAAMAAAQGVLAAGFWKLWNWARIVVLVMIALSGIAETSNATNARRMLIVAGLCPSWLVRPMKTSPMPLLNCVLGFVC